jgi:hypothetical protein
VANPWATDSPAEGWPPKGHVVMTPQRPSDYHPFSVCQIMGATFDARQEFDEEQMLVFDDAHAHHVAEFVAFALQMRAPCVRVENGAAHSGPKCGENG